MAENTWVVLLKVRIVVIFDGEYLGDTGMRGNVPFLELGADYTGILRW